MNINEEPSLGVVEALLSRTVDDLLDFYEQDAFILRQRQRIPWPESASVPPAEKGRLYDQSKDYYIVEPGVSPKYPHGLTDRGDEDALQWVTFDLLERLNPQQKVKATRWIFRLADLVPPSEMMDSFAGHTTRFIEKSPNNEELFGLLMRYLYQRRNKIVYSYHNKDFRSAVDDLAWSAGTFHERSMVKSLAFVKDETKIRPMIKLVVQLVSFPDTINWVRDILEDDSVAAPAQARLEKVGRILLGLDPNDDSLPFHTRLENLYAVIKFEEYLLSLRTEEARIALLKGLFKRQGISSDARILDLGCGTGWLVSGLRREGYTNVYGIDLTKRHIQVATEKYGPYFSLGSWFDLPQRGKGVEVPFGEESQDVIFCLGRSLTHAEDEEKLRQVIRNISNTARPGALVVVDMPNPRQGRTWEYVRRYREQMRKLGFLEKEVEDLWFICDSPDGKNFYNRYVPPEGKMVNILSAGGFKILETRKEEAPDDRGDMTVVFICRKLS